MLLHARRGTRLLLRSRRPGMPRVPPAGGPAGDRQRRRLVRRLCPVQQRVREIEWQRTARLVLENAGHLRRVADQKAADMPAPTRARTTGVQPTPKPATTNTIAHGPALPPTDPAGDNND